MSEIICLHLFQLALLGWLKTDSVQCKELLTAVTGMQVAREVLDRLSGQKQIDAYRVRCVYALLMSFVCRELS